jgi:hypothetical protein
MEKTFKILQIIETSPSDSEKPQILGNHSRLNSVDILCEIMYSMYVLNFREFFGIFIYFLLILILDKFAELVN